MDKQKHRLILYNRVKKLTQKEPINIHIKYLQMDKCKLLYYRIKHLNNQ